jgi:hypothetical protein
MEQVISSSWELIEWGDVGVCQEMIYDSAKASVNRSSSARCHIRKHGYSGHDAWKQHSDDSKNTLEQ